MSVQNTGDSKPPCRTCGGNGVIKIQAQHNGKPVEKSVTCPSCRGSRKAGYIVK